MSAANFRVTVFYGGFESSNIFLVENGVHALLVDAGMPEAAEAAAEQIQKSSLPEPEAVVLTHRHIDHVAGLPVIKREFGEIPVFAERSGAEALNTGDAISTGAALFGLPLPQMDVTPLPVRVREGTASPLPPFLENFEVFGTPGHSEDSIVLFHGESNSLFSGDTVFANGGVGRWDLPTGSLSELIKSIDFLRTLDAKSLYPGHGPAVESGGKFHIEDSYRALEAYI